MSDYQSDVKKLLDFTENVLTNLLNDKNASQNSLLQRAMIETKLRKSSRDHSKFQKLIKRRQLHKVPIDVVKEEVMEYDDILPYQRLSKYFSYYVNADKMDQIEFNNRVESYIRSNQKFGFKNEKKIKPLDINRIGVSSREEQVRNQSPNTINTPKNNISRFQKTQDIPVPNNPANQPEYKAFPSKPVGNKPVKTLKEKVEIRDCEVTTNNATSIKQQPKPVTSYTNTIKPLNQISQTEVQYSKENKTSESIDKEDKYIQIINNPSIKVSDKKKSTLSSNGDEPRETIDKSENSKVHGNLIELESTEVVGISSKSGLMDGIFDKDQPIKVMEEIVQSQNKELGNNNMTSTKGLKYSYKKPDDELRNSGKILNKKSKSPDESVNKEVKDWDKIPNKETNVKEQDIISIKDKDNKKAEEKQYVPTVNIKTNDNCLFKSPTEEDKKSAAIIDTKENSVNNSSNEVGKEELTANDKVTLESDPGRPKVGDKRKLNTKDQAKSYKKSKGKTNINKKSNNNNNNNNNISISNKIENLIERIQNSKITLETLLGPVTNGTTFEQFHKVEPPSPKIFEKKNKNEDANNIRLIQLYDSITKSDESDGESSDSVKGGVHISDSKQMNNQIYNNTISAISDNDNDNINKVNAIWNNMTTDENDPKENIPLNNPVSDANQSIYDAYMSNYNNGLPLPTTVKNFSDNDFKFKSILFGNDNHKNVLSTNNPFITSHPNKQMINISSSTNPTERIVNKKVPKALKKMSNLVSKYNLDES